MRHFYRSLMFLSGCCLVLVSAMVALAIVARELRWGLAGLDAYAGYLIAGALFLALPETFRRQELLRVNLVFERLGTVARSRLQTVCLLLGVIASSWVAFFASRLVLISWRTHDISSGSDATSLWIPQLLMALGCIGLAIAFCDALIAQLRGREFFVMSSDPARVE
jgi:TRAP-type C4-dicarboxylate transport system permease small subunit